MANYSFAMEASKLPEYHEPVRRRSRKPLIVAWVVLIVTSVIFCVFALTTFRNVRRIAQYEAESKLEWIEADGSVKVIGTFGSHYVWGVLTSCLFPSVLVILFLVLGTPALCRLFTPEWDLFLLHILHASVITAALVLLQSAVVLLSFSTLVSAWWSQAPSWSTADTNMYKATYAVGFGVSGLYFLFFVVFAYAAY